MKPTNVVRMKAGNTADTAPSLQFIPTADELALIDEALRIAIPRLDRLALETETVLPTSPLVERMRMYAESMADVRARIAAG